MTQSGDNEDAGRAVGADTGEPLRASDADRFATMRALQDAISRGLLTPDEGSERIAAALAATHRHELDPLVADLGVTRIGGGAPGWRALGSMTVEQVRASLSRPTTSRLSPGRIIVTTLVVVLILLLVGFVVAELFFDGPGGRGGGGFGRR